MDGKKFRVSRCALTLLVAAGCQYRAQSVSYSLPITPEISCPGAAGGGDDCGAAGYCADFAGTAWEDYTNCQAPGTVRHHETTTQLTVWPLHRISFGHPCGRTDEVIVRLPPAPKIIYEHCPAGEWATRDCGVGHGANYDHFESSHPLSAPEATPHGALTDATLSDASQKGSVAADVVQHGGPKSVPPRSTLPSTLKSTRPTTATSPAVSAREVEKSSPPLAPLPKTDLTPRSTRPTRTPQSAAPQSGKTSQPDSSSPLLEASEAETTPTEQEDSDTDENSSAGSKNSSRPPRNVVPKHVLDED